MSQEDNDKKDDNSSKGNAEAKKAILPNPPTPPAPPPPPPIGQSNAVRSPKTEQVGNAFADVKRQIIERGQKATSKEAEAPAQERDDKADKSKGQSAPSVFSGSAIDRMMGKANDANTIDETEDDEDWDADLDDRERKQEELRIQRLKDEQEVKRLEAAKKEVEAARIKREREEYLKNNPVKASSTVNQNFDPGTVLKKGLSDRRRLLGEDEDENKDNNLTSERPSAAFASSDKVQKTEGISKTDKANAANNLESFFKGRNKGKAIDSQSVAESGKNQNADGTILMTESSSDNSEVVGEDTNLADDEILSSPRVGRPSSMSPVQGMPPSPPPMPPVQKGKIPTPPPPPAPPKNPSVSMVNKEPSLATNKDIPKPPPKPTASTAKKAEPSVLKEKPLDSKHETGSNRDEILTKKDNSPKITELSKKSPDADIPEKPVEEIDSPKDDGYVFVNPEKPLVIPKWEMFVPKVAVKEPESRKSKTVEDNVNTSKKLAEEISTFSDAVGVIPPREGVSSYFPGIRLGNVMCLGDKTSGIEPGQLFYVRDDKYHHALQNVFERFRNNDELIKSIKSVESMKEISAKVYVQYLEKFKYDIPKNKGKPLSFKDFYNSNYINANLLFTSKDKYSDNDLESKMSENPILAAILFKGIDKLPKEMQPTKWMIKLDFTDPGYFNRVRPKTIRMMKTNTVKKITIKNYAQKLLKAISDDPNISSHSDEFKAKLKENEKISPKEDRVKNLSKIIKDMEKTLMMVNPEKLFKAKLSSMNSKAKFKLWVSKVARWFKGKIFEESKGALNEVIANDHALRSGLSAQSAHVIDGSWRQHNSGIPKKMVAVKWEAGFDTFEDLSNKSKETDMGVGLKNLQFSGNGSNLAESSYFCGEDKNGQLVSASHLISDLGSQYALFLRYGDRDAIGKAGQNKGVVKDESAVGETRFKMFGIDFGKCWSNKNLAANISDDFSFKQTSKLAATQIVNYAMFDDTSYVEKMKGMHVLAKQLMLSLNSIDRFILSIGKDYDLENRQFDDKQTKRAEYLFKQKEIITGLISTIPQSVKDSFEEIWNNDHISDPNLAFLEQINSLDEQIATLRHSIKDSNEGVAKSKKEIKIINDKINQLVRLKMSVMDTHEIALNNDVTIFGVFKNRLLLTKNEVSMVDGLEKYLSKGSVTSEDGKVRLNHIKVKPQDRVKVEVTKRTENEFEFSINHHNKISPDALFDMILKLKNSLGEDEQFKNDVSIKKVIESMLLTVTNESETLSITRPDEMTSDQFKDVCQLIFSEKIIAQRENKFKDTPPLLMDSKDAKMQNSPQSEPVITATLGDIPVSAESKKTESVIFSKSAHPNQMQLQHFIQLKKTHPRDLIEDVVMGVKKKDHAYYICDKTQSTVIPKVMVEFNPVLQIINFSVFSDDEKSLNLLIEELVKAQELNTLARLNLDFRGDEQLMKVFGEALNERVKGEKENSSKLRMLEGVLQRLDIKNNDLNNKNSL